MIEGLFAGMPTNPKRWSGGREGWSRWALFPAAATIRHPPFSARRPTVSYAWETWGTSAPRDMEMTSVRFATAQLIPARIPASLPDPWSLRTLPTKISAS